jgi:hypothetical protein
MYGIVLCAGLCRYSLERNTYADIRGRNCANERPELAVADLRDGYRSFTRAKPEPEYVRDPCVQDYYNLQASKHVCSTSFTSHTSLLIFRRP